MTRTPFVFMFRKLMKQHALSCVKLGTALLLAKNLLLTAVINENNMLRESYRYLTFRIVEFERAREQHIHQFRKQAVIC